MAKDIKAKTAEELLREERAEVRDLRPFEYYLVAIISGYTPCFRHGSSLSFNAML
jgi:hypothetical protein